MKFRFGVLHALGIAALAALLASCGGEELVPFNPARILVFGDQASVITVAPVASEGRKYTINAVNPDTGAIDCTRNLIWIQILATNYGMGFPECPLPIAADATAAQIAAASAARIRAQAGATAGGTGAVDLTQQITRQLALPVADGGGIGATDLVAVYIGVNDVISAFERYKSGVITQADAIAQAEQAGSTYAAQVNRIANSGGKVIMATVPSVGVTPYANALADLADRALLVTLTERVNARLLVEIDNNGRKIGLIEINPYVAAVIGDPLAYGYLNVEDAACVPVNVLECTAKPDSLQPDATVATWLWADALQLSPQGHAQLGSLAYSRARSQPF